MRQGSVRNYCGRSLPANMIARAIARELNKREIPTPGGGPWHATTVIRVQQRLKGKLCFSFGKS